MAGEEKKESRAEALAWIFEYCSKSDNPKLAGLVGDCALRMAKEKAVYDSGNGPKMLEVVGRALKEVEKQKINKD